MPKLKVFCTASGFHDSVVAAPSRPAALKAWGARTDLFSMGVARQVTDPKIVEQALARPGEVIRFSRSGHATDAPAPKKKKKARQPVKPPSRARLAAAKKRLQQLQDKQARERDAIDKQVAALTRKLDQLAKSHAAARHKAEEKIDEAREDYEAALADWDG